MESRLGYDFAQVRVHTDAKAAESAQAVGAQAYTLGRDVVFGSGQYAPGTTDGLRLLAHELTHVLQQHSHVVERGKTLRVGSSEYAGGRQADLFASAVINPSARQTLPETGAARQGVIQRQSVTPPPPAPTPAPPPAPTPAGPAARLTIRLGSRGPDVIELQRLLVALVPPPHPPINGIFGQRTRWSVVRFQYRQHLPHDGVVTPAVWAALDRASRDLHLETELPTASQVRAVQEHISGVPLIPSHTPAPAPGAPTPAPAPLVRARWDGATTGGVLTPAAAANRINLRREMLTAMSAFLSQRMLGITPMVGVTRHPVATLEGAGRAAKRVVDDRFGAYASASALTTHQAHGRTAFNFRPGADLVDRSNPAMFTPNPPDLADWIAESAPDAADAQLRHNFDKDDPSAVEERNFYYTDIIPSFMNGNAALGLPSHLSDLEQFDRYGFAATNIVRGEPRVEIIPHERAAGAGAGAAPTPSDRFELWDSWTTLTHEYLHTLEHPAFNTARGMNRDLFEGFVTMFDEEVLQQWIPIARADSDPALRGDVEGRNSAGGLWPGFRPSFVPSFNPRAYAVYLRRVQGMRRALGWGGEAAMRAAFFQGHVELIGLTPSGGAATGRTDTPDTIEVPFGIPNVTALARATGVAEAVIVSANAGLAAGAALTPGQRLRVPGCSLHVVGGATMTDHGTVVESQTERRATIALQHNISELALARANPRTIFTTLHPGDRVLIPAH
jgi:peptidoglycan hydrolase-like protein with peptidoglycan-binding domain